MGQKWVKNGSKRGQKWPKMGKNGHFWSKLTLFGLQLRSPRFSTFAKITKMAIFECENSTHLTKTPKPPKTGFLTI